MTDKKKADQQASPKNTHVNDTSSNAQRIRLLDHMLTHGSVNTFQAMRQLNILRPGARIAELRAAGHMIKTHLGTLEDDQGRRHPKVATYYITAQPSAGSEEAA
ncbi:hypothetical protein BVH03_17405 [Pseudomonas sp. PA15(2017)]|uniref:helix-turn-helix domain-containing protein n=1 Tax=Pseudomonas sp. PA15(2017) TaxID=1932111 RepID=UPI00095B5556|nr:helix-turn-helix domain-containing protein [Pseudomonas sp. PA15(2017)]OLU25436.1 hypothetical protein BVH03_17405 [Pseudomonas sp. PA15(2017)]